jgi:hypothetical protein
MINDHRSCILWRDKVRENMQKRVEKMGNLGSRINVE